LSRSTTYLYIARSRILRWNLELDLAYSISNHGATKHQKESLSSPVAPCDWNHTYTMAMETYHGHVRTPADAIKLFEACRLGLLPRVQRRLSEKERQSIKSGSVFVWDEREAGMRRWTDGKSWSASRVSGSFLTYREMEGKRGGGNFVPPPVRRQAGKTPDSTRGSDEDAEMDADGPDGYRYKPDGLMKQSFSITTSTGQHLHLISYYARPHSQAPDLMQPTNDPNLRNIVPVKGMYPESTVHEQSQGPVTTRTPMQSAYMPSPQQMMPGPHRAGPYVYQPVTQGYQWPPSPVQTPPYATATFQVDQWGRPIVMAAPPHTQAGSAHASPLQVHYSPQHPPHAYPPTSGPLPPQPTVFDRLPPSLHDSSLPPPPPIHRIQISAPPAPMAIPTYTPNISSRVDQGRMVAEQQQAQHVQAQAQLQQQQAAQAQAQAQAQQAQNAQRIAQQSQMALDPRLSSTVGTSIPPIQASSPAANGVPARSTPPQSYSQPPSATHTPVRAESSSQSIPSISNLVNGVTASPPLSAPQSQPIVPSPAPTLPQPNTANGDTRSPEGSRAGSRSPLSKIQNSSEDIGAKAEDKSDGDKKEGGPKDFAADKMGEKMGFGEDVRALRVLDRKFCI
jgi:hypothetical protein